MIVSQFLLLLVGIRNSAVGLKICVITAEIKKSITAIINKSKKTQLFFLTKSKLNSIEVLISKALIDSYISHDEIDEIEEKIKNPKIK